MQNYKSYILASAVTVKVYTSSSGNGINTAHIPGEPVSEIEASYAEDGYTTDALLLCCMEASRIDADDLSEDEETEFKTVEGDLAAALRIGE